MAELRKAPTRLHSFPMRRVFLFAFLSLLLLSMQQEGAVHALSHLGPQLARAHDTGLASPQADGACAECALLAGGANALPGHAGAIAAVVAATKRAPLAFRSRATAAPVYFSSRAPPFLL